MRKPLLWVVLAAASLVGCGDNQRVDGDGGVGPDAEVDAMTCEFAAGALGGPCENDDQCDSATNTNGFCWNGAKLPSVFPPEGYCTIDNGAGTVCSVDADCGAGGVCVDSAGYFMCLPACCPGDICAPNQACWTSFNGYPHDRPACVPGNAQGNDGDACVGFFDCNEFSQCVNDFETPGGVCSAYACAVGDDTTCYGGTCTTINEVPDPGPICVDACETDGDCRESEGYRCFDPDPVGTTDVKYCRHPHVGDPCTTPAECGTGTWECLTGTFIGGYCTQSGCPTPGTSEGCTAFSLCHDNGAENVCVDRCSTIGSVTECRTGYTCTDVDPGGPMVGGCVPTI